MTQPPDDRRRMPWEPEPSDAAEQPTVQWSPPQPPTERGPEPDPAPSADPETADAPATGTSADEPAPPVTPAQPVTPEPPAEPLAPSSGPLLSSTPSQPTVGWQSDAPGPAPVVGWQTPTSSAEPAPIEGYVIAGPWARLVAWFIDSLLVAFVPTLASFLIIDWQPLVDAVAEQIENPSTVAPVVFLPTTVEGLIVAIIGVGISYLYFVGFWTGPWMATPGMRLMRMRVGDEQRGAILSLSAATKRWLVMGSWLALLAYVGPLAAIAGIGAQVLQIVLFITVIVNARRQGLHDRVAGSLVVRERAAGDSVVAGCIVLIGLIAIFSIVIGVVSVAVLLPLMEPLFDEMVVPR